MSDTPPIPDIAHDPRPIALRRAHERHAHVARRMLERGGLVWTPEQVLALEKKIRFVRSQHAQNKPVVAILPTKIGEEKNGAVHRYRVLIASEAHTFAFSQVCRGLVSYVGKGVIAPVVTVPPVAPTKEATP